MLYFGISSRWHYSFPIGCHSTTAAVEGALRATALNSGGGGGYQVAVFHLKWHFCLIWGRLSSLVHLPKVWKLYLIKTFFSYSNNVNLEIPEGAASSYVVTAVLSVSGGGSEVMDRQQSRRLRVGAASPAYGPSLSLRLLESEQYGRRSFTSIMLLLVPQENIQSCCCSAAHTEGLTARWSDRRTDGRWDGRTDGGTEGRASAGGGRADGWMERQVVELHLESHTKRERSVAQSTRNTLWASAELK